MSTKSYWERDANALPRRGPMSSVWANSPGISWEPYEGRFSFDLFDRAIAGSGAPRDHNTILCTPTATPPRWMTRDYPESWRVGMMAASWATRSAPSIATPLALFLRALSRRITQALADHYLDHPDVIGWQTDNELNTTISESYSPSCRLAFQVWLRQRYGGDTSPRLTAPGAVISGHWPTTASPMWTCRGRWALLPVAGACAGLPPFPSRRYRRLPARSGRYPARRQPRLVVFPQPLAHLADIDFRGDFGADLDFIGFDIYPMLYDEFRRTGGHEATQAWHLDVCRAWTGNFIVPEQASGLGSQPAFSTMTPEPGEMRRMALTSVARGADGVCYSAGDPRISGPKSTGWASSITTTCPRRRYEEASQFFHELKALEPHLLGTHVRMDLGIAGADFDNQEAHKTYPIGWPAPSDDANLLHRAAYHRGIACGLIHPEDDLSPLKVLYVPHWVMWKP